MPHAKPDAKPDDDEAMELDADDLSAWDAQALAPGFEDRVLDTMASQPSVETLVPAAAADSESPGRRWLLPLTVAASVAAASLLVVGLRTTNEAPLPSAHAVVATASDGAAYALQGSRATQLSGSVRYVVPPRTPFVVSTPAADVVVTGTDFTVEMLSMNDQRRKTWMGAAALALGGAAVAVYVHDGGVRVQNEHGVALLQAGGVAVASEHTSPREKPRATPTVVKSPPAVAKTKRLSPAERTDVLRRLNAAVAARGSAPDRDEEDAPQEDPDAMPHGSLDKDYIRDVVSEDLVPILTECYQSALEDQPKLGGKLVLQFSIVGDESVGGIVEEVELSQELSTLKHPDLEECMAESATTLLFDPPEGGGRVNITYPFVFSPEEGEGEGEGEEQSLGEDEGEGEAQ